MKINLDLIEPGQRLRDVSPAQVQALKASMADVGLLNPITIYRRKLFRGGNQIDGYGLVAGLHRLTAAVELGWTDIEATVSTLEDLERQIAECDENLIAPSLSPSDRARFVKRRKEAYEALRPETRHGTPGVSRQVGDTRERVDAGRFTADTAKATGQSERVVQRDAERGEKVLPEVFDLIRGTTLDTGAYLDKLKKMPGSEQFKAATRDLAFERKQTREASREGKAKDKFKRQLHLLSMAWETAPQDVRDAFKRKFNLVGIVKPTKSLQPGARHQ